MAAEDPALQQRLRAQPEQIDVFVEEALRLESPLREMLRSVPRDTTLGGVDIPADSTVLLLFTAGNRDPAQFDNPDSVDLTRRSPKRHLALATASISASVPRSRGSRPARCSTPAGSPAPSTAHHRDRAVRPVTTGGPRQGPICERQPRLLITRQALSSPPIAVIAARRSRGCVDHPRQHKRTSSHDRRESRRRDSDVNQTAKVRVVVG
jgi:hypothetical protein